MKQKYVQFIVRLVAVSLAAGAVALLANALLGPGFITPALPWLLGMFFIVTAAVHYFLLHITSLRPARFVGYFMAATFVKLLIYLIVLVVYVFLINKEGLLAFVLAFFILYLIYTAFEVVMILAQTKQSGS